MLVEFFLERARIELAPDQMSYRGYVPDLPEIRVTAATAEQCRAKLTGAISALLAIEASRGRAAETEAAEESPELGGQASARLGGQELQTGDELTGDSNLTFADIIYEKQPWIARVTINRPSVYNTYTDQTLREMTAAFRDAAGDDSIAVVVLTGAGDKAFSAGGDVRQHIEEHIDNPQATREWIGALIEAHTALRQMGKPSIARINGMVAGGGNEWSLACDLAIAADQAKFVQVETKVGLVSAAGASHWLSLLIGERRAREVFLTGEPISANKALLWGLVNDVVPYKQLDRAVDSLCKKLIDRFPESVRCTREQLSFWKDLAWNSILRYANDQAATHFCGDEASTGLRALFETGEIDYREFRAYSSRKVENQSEIIEPLKQSTKETKGPGLSCYSCGAQDIPDNYAYCGMCGTRLV